MLYLFELYSWDELIIFTDIKDLALLFFFFFFLGGGGGNEIRKQIKKPFLSCLISDINFT